MTSSPRAHNLRRVVPMQRTPTAGLHAGTGYARGRVALGGPVARILLPNVAGRPRRLSKPLREDRSA
jgi:hypothetical protein